LDGLDGSIELVGVGQCHPVGVGEPCAPVLDALFDLAKEPAATKVLRCLDAVAPGWLLQLPALVDVDHGSALVNRTLGSTPERILQEALDLFDALASVGYGPLVLTIACSLFHLGEFDDAIQHAREALSHYDSDRDRTALAVVGENAFVTSQHWAAFSLWFTGYPDTALGHSQAAVRMVRRPDYAFSLCLALEMAAMLHQLRREPVQVAELAGEMQTLAVQGGLPYR
jgi:tetratricopeptide (TPR) repeat protein